MPQGLNALVTGVRKLSTPARGAVDGDGLATQVRGLVGGEEDGEGGEFFGSGDTAEGEAGGDGVDIPCVLESICRREAGAEIVNGDAVFRIFDRECFDQAIDGGADGVRQDESGEGLFDGYAGDGEEASPVLLLHEWQDFAGEVDGAHQAVGDGGLPVVDGGVGELFEWGSTGVGDADVDAAETFVRGFYQGFDLGLVGDVADHG